MELENWVRIPVKIYLAHLALIQIRKARIHLTLCSVPLSYVLTKMTDLLDDTMVNWKYGEWAIKKTTLL